MIPVRFLWCDKSPLPASKKTSKQNFSTLKLRILLMNRDKIIHISYGEFLGEVVDVNSDAIVFKDEDGNHLFRVSDVPMIITDEKQVVNKELMKFERRMRIKATILYSLILSSLPLALVFVKWLK